MGIPSYFSYIIKNHANIIRNLKYHRSVGKKTFSSIYLDCNSIIYDAVRSVETESSANDSEKEDRIITAVLQNIWKYIELVQPTETAYIAFDGVAPFAKMSQQRTRRYKTGYIASLDFDTISSKTAKPNKWNTTAITPGTNFMKTLSVRVRREFETSASRVGCKSIVVSASDEPGEGEHKMFDYMRQNALPDETIVVYGLDADLIMLSLFHVFAYENIYIFREQPEFAKSLFMDNANHSDEMEYLLMDCRGLAKAVLNEMGLVSKIATTEQMRGRIYDYIFMCFFLGNDFLPHFPALNIRTHGIYTLMEIYKRIIGTNESRCFINMANGQIQWNWVKTFVAEIAKKEHQYITHEYETRNKLETKYYPLKTSADRENAFNNIPTIYRAEEHYVCPYERGWETRYYETAFHLNSVSGNSTEFIRKVCVNYLEGLEWVFKYYTAGCPHWKWKYNYHYPPLFSDLVKYIPEFETEFICGTTDPLNRPFSANAQLAYVVPKWNHGLLPRNAKLLKFVEAKRDYYVELNELQFMYAYKKYMWEAEIILPEISREELELL